MAGYDAISEIAKPIHVLGVATPEEYERLQLSYLQRQSRASRQTLEIWDVADSVDAYIRGSKWIVNCVCGNAPSASPEWNVARCLECGAVFRNIRWPADRTMIECLLLLRRSSSERAWHPGESVEDLRQENIGHGIRGDA